MGRAALVGLGGITIANIIGRLLSRPIPGAHSYATIFGLILVSLGMAYCQVNKGNLSMGLVIERLPQRAQAIVDSITSMVSTVLFMVLAWRCGVLGTQFWEEGLQIGVTGLPVYPFVYIIGFGSFMLALILMIDTYRNILKVMRR